MKGLYSLVGMKFFNAESLVGSLPNGEPLTLIREPNNPHDPHAIQVWARRRLCLGYIGRGRKPNVEKYAPGNDNEALAKFMDDKKDMLDAKLVLIAGGAPMVEVEE